MEEKVREEERESRRREEAEQERKRQEYEKALSDAAKEVMRLYSEKEKK